jgi:hypothetical protein
VMKMSLAMMKMRRKVFRLQKAAWRHDKKASTRAANVELTSETEALKHIASSLASAKWKRSACLLKRSYS